MKRPESKVNNEELHLEVDTYKNILSSITHPIRRRVLRQLANGGKTYTQLMKDQNIDSGHLSYHIRYLGELITQKNGKYALTKHGESAIALMQRVEGRTSKIWSQQEFQSNLQIIPSLTRETRLVTLILTLYGLIITGIGLGSAFATDIIFQLMMSWQLVLYQRATYSLPEQYNNVGEVFQANPHYWLTIPIQILVLFTAQFFVIWKYRNLSNRRWLISTFLAAIYIGIAAWVGLTGPTYIFTMNRYTPFVIIGGLRYYYLPIVFLSLILATPRNLRIRALHYAIQHIDISYKPAN